MALLRKIFPLVYCFIIFKRAECSSSLLRVDNKLLLKNRSILPSRKLCFLENADLSSTSRHAISSGKQNNFKSMHSLPSFQLISFVTALVFGLSRHKVAHAAGNENNLDHALTKCCLERKQKVTNKMHSLCASKDMNAEPPVIRKSPGRDEEPTDSQVSSFTMEYIDAGHHCHM